MDSKTEPASEAKERKMSKEQQWLAYVAKLRNEHDEEITRLKAELEKSKDENKVQKIIIDKYFEEIQSLRDQINQK